MLFNSLEFLVFLPVVILLYYQLNHRQRQVLLLVSSYVFYWCWSIKWSFLLATATVVDYFVAIILERMRPGWKRKAVLCISIGANLGMLGFFKYSNFLSEAGLELFGVRPWPILDLVLPMGISFYTFMTLSYTIDVYRGHVKARRDLLEMAVFVSYWPHLVAGPILRAPELLPQLETCQRFNWANIRLGLGLILWGMLKKVYVADPMAGIVNEAYADPASCSGLGLLMATYAFAVQIYCDFSGYSDIAIGSARLMGVSLPENFRTPYLSLSIREFWRRWHITLSSWLRDYLYIPLGGSRKGEFRTYINLMITMLLGGLWHGAGWNWVVWGGIQGAVMSGERFFRVSEQAPASVIAKAVRWAVTFHIVCFSWIFFRSQSVADAWDAVVRIVSWAPGEYYGGFAPVGVLGVLLVGEMMRFRFRWLDFVDKRPTLLRWIVYAAVVVLAVTFAGAGNPEFIYFQF